VWDHDTARDEVRAYPVTGIPGDPGHPRSCPARLEGPSFLAPPGYDGSTACWTAWATKLGHQPVTVIWDNLGAHHTGELHSWAATQPWLGWSTCLVRAGAGPGGGLWANLKSCELANRCCADRTELIATAQVGSIHAHLTWIAA
jgi:hypothetical protein